MSKTLGNIVPNVIDLTNSGDDDDAMEKNINGLDEDSKKKCLRVLFTYLKSNRTKLVGKIPPATAEKKLETENSKPTDEATGQDDIVPSDEAREDSSESKKKKKRRKRKGVLSLTLKQFVPTAMFPPMKNQKILIKPTKVSLEDGWTMNHLVKIILRNIVWLVGTCQ